MKTILLLHGWNYRNYTNMTDSNDAWDNRAGFVDLLQDNYKVYKINFPGFCGQEEPKEKSWNLSHFATFVNKYIIDNNLKIDYIIGYSFGGAVALKYNLMYDRNQKLILISPAIVRNMAESKHFIKTPKILEPLRNSVRNFYLKKIKKNNYMVNGTKFLNNTYQSIVREKLIDDLIKIDAENINIIYGKKDTMVNPMEVYNSLDKQYAKKVTFIEEGGHDIANTNTEELVNVIKKITK